MRMIEEMYAQIAAEKATQQACQNHEWREVIDCCEEWRPCRGSVLGRKCALCGLFEGAAVTVDVKR